VSLPLSDPAAASGARVAPRRGMLSNLFILGRRRDLRVYFGAQQLQLTLIARHRKPQSIASLSRPYVGSENNDRTTGLEGSTPTNLIEASSVLGPALSELDAKLRSLGLGGLRGAPCDVTLGDTWMLYDVVRADLRALAPRAADALIASSLADVAGVQASELACRWQAQARSSFTLACGVPSAALAEIERALRAQGLAVRSIKGEFVRICNRYLRLKPERAVVALVRLAGVQLATMVDGVLTAMSFESGIQTASMLEQRGRGLLRTTGAAEHGPLQFYAFAPEGWQTPAPWVCLPVEP